MTSLKFYIICLFQSSMVDMRKSEFFLFEVTFFFLSKLIDTTPLTDCRCDERLKVKVEKSFVVKLLFIVTR
jgi:hypothetical protein